MSKYVFTKGMGEISGFGGGYEQACRRMLVAGLTWLDAHPEAKPTWKQLNGVFGICDAVSDDAKALDEVITAAVPDCSGAMYHAVVGHLLFIQKNGWDAYCKEMQSERAREGEAKRA